MAQQTTKQRSKPVEPQPSSQRMTNNSLLSPAELYIIQQSQMLLDVNDSLSGTSSVSSSTNSIKHAEKMHEWHQQQSNEIYKQEPYRYKYGTPPSSTFRRIDTQPDPYGVQTTSTDCKMKK